MARMEALRSFRSPSTQESVRLDLSDPDQQAGVAALYGGIESMAAQYPLLREAFENSCADPSVAKPIGQPTDFADGAVIGGVTWERVGNRLTVRAATSLTDRAYFIDDHLEVRTSAGEIVGGISQSSVDTCHSELVYETDFDPRSFASDVLELDFASNWVRVGERSLHSMLTSKDVHEEAYLNTQVKAVHVLGPVKKTAGKTAPVNICYNRFPLAQEDIDYLYQESFSSITGVQRLFAPVSAWVEFELDEQGRQDPFRSIDITSFHLKMDCQNGIARYDTSGRTTLVEHHFVAQPDAQKTYASGFSFELDPEWRADVPSRRWPKRDRVDMLFEVSFMHESGKRGSIELSTTVDESTANVGKVDWLNLLWGCVARGSLVRMADGSDRRIEEIRPGDSVLSDASGRVSTVVNVLTGHESNPLVAVSVTNGSLVLCTREHPVVTDQGIMRADELHGDCRLYGPDGDALVINGIWDIESPDVVNLELDADDASGVAGDAGGADDAGGTFFAGGILVGDNTMQAALAWQASHEALADNPFRAECAARQSRWEERS